MTVRAPMTWLCLLGVQAVTPMLVLAQTKPIQPSQARVADKDSEKPAMFYQMPGYVSAEGQWRALSGKPADEVAYSHVVKIECRSDIKDCSEATAKVFMGLLQISVAHYDVIHWDDNGIIAEDNSSICATNRLLISTRERSVMTMDVPKADAKGKGIPIEGGKHMCDVIDHTDTYKLIGQVHSLFSERKAGTR